MLKVFLHAALINDASAPNNWQDVLTELVDSIRFSGLEAHADKIYVCVAGAKGTKLRPPMLPSKYECLVWSLLNEYEFPALRMLWDNTGPADRVCYLHTKGVSHPGDKPSIDWRQYMLWAVIERWRECVGALAEYDIAGAQWHDRTPRWCKIIGSPGWFAGNFWWARGDYIKRLAVLENSSQRWFAEGWIGRGYAAPNDPRAEKIDSSNGRVMPRVFEIHRLAMDNLVGFDSVKKTGIFQEGFCRKFYTSNPPLGSQPEIRLRWDVLNFLVKKYKYKSYLEIGVANGDTFRRVTCEDKVGVDPSSTHATHGMTSDAWFAGPGKNRKFDLIFVDGLHTEEQADRDIKHALERLSPNGSIAVHDCTPESDWEQRDIADYDGVGVWVGTVWRSWCKLRITRPDLNMRVIDTDHGVGVIRRGTQKLFNLKVNETMKQSLSYPLFARHRAELLNLVLPETLYD
jgi:hypothetical protein